MTPELASKLITRIRTSGILGASDYLEGRRTVGTDEWEIIVWTGTQHTVITTPEDWTALATERGADLHV